MAVFQNVQNLTIIGSSINSVFNNVPDNESNTTNIAGPSSNPTGHAQTILTMTSAGSVTDIPLPPENKKPPRLTTMFTGRRDILQQISRFFDGPRSSKVRKMQKVFVLYGLGGAGKTSIMMKFVDEFSDRFSTVYYVDASTLATLQANFQSIARNASAGQTVDDALQWLAQQHDEWLLLLDNADDPSIDLHQFFPRCRHGNIIVTSRNKACRLYAPDSNCCVSNMEPNDAIELLLKYNMADHSDENRRLCATIAQELGYFALAVAQAGAYISQSSCLDSYLQIYQTDRVELLQRHSAQTTDDYKWTVYTTWEMNLRRMSPTALTFLRTCAFMHHEGISGKIFRKAAAEEPGDSFQAGIAFLQNFKTEDGRWSEIRFRDCIHELSSYSLIDIHSSGDVYSIHPLVHSWAKDRISTEEREQGQMWTMQILALPIPLDHSTDTQVFRRSLISHVDAARVGNVTAEIAERFSLVYGDCGRWSDAEELLKFVVESRKTELGDDHPKTLNSMNNLVYTYNYQERWKEAEELALQILEARKRLFGDEHEDTLYIKGNLALAYSGQGRLGEAETLHKEAWEARRKVLGDEHPNTLFSKYHLALSYTNQGQLEKAETLQVEALEAKRRVLGDEHPFTLESQANLACIYRDQGRLKEAAVLLSPLIEASRRVLGNNHPKTQHFVGLHSDLPKTRATVVKDALRHPIAYLRRQR